MADRIKGLVVEIGGDTTGLSKALGGVNKEIRDTQTQLRDVERLLKLDPTNTELLAQKQRLLADKVEATKKKLNALKEAEKQVQAQFERGDVSQEQYDALRREIIDVEHALRETEDAARDTDRALSGIGRFGAAAGNLSSKADGVAKAFKPATTAVLGIAGAAVATVPATAELREELSRLDANAEESSVGVDKAREAWRLFAAQSGDTGAAVEATSNLLQAGFTESNLQIAVEGLAGAAQRFPDTLKVESLADSLQETLATGAATGAFAELLDRVGYGAENFSTQLEACSTAADQQALVLQTLADTGLNASYEAWAKNNEELLENKEANLEWQETTAQVAEAILPVITEVTQVVSKLIQWFMGLDDETKRIIITTALLIAAISPVAGVISNISGAISFLCANPIVALVAAIVALVLLIAVKGDEIQAKLQKLDDWLQNIFCRDWTEVFGPVLGGILNAWFANVKNVWDSVKKVFDGLIDFIRGVFTGDWERAWNGVKEIFAGVFGLLEGIAKAPINGIIGLVNGAISGINALIRSINKIPGVSIGEIGKIPYLANGGIVRSGSAIVGEAGPELLTVNGGAAKVEPLTQYNTSNTNHSYGGISVNVYGAPGQDVDDLAEAVAEKIEDLVERGEAVFA